jgi:SAM-dependent methyltransferase
MLGYQSAHYERRRGTPPVQRDNLGYDEFFGSFDSELSRKVRADAYRRDIGQHSWVTAEDLVEDVERLRLTRASRLLDLGCRPAGPLTFVVELSGCRGCGFDLSASALASGRRRASALGLDELVELREELSTRRFLSRSAPSMR